MKPRAQSYVLLLITLLIGMLLGALIQSSIRSKRINHLRMLRSDEMFITEMVAAIDPQSQAQADQVNAILSEVSPNITNLVRQNRDRVRAQLELLESRLYPLLDEDQQMRLKRRLHPPRPKREDEEKD